MSQSNARSGPGKRAVALHYGTSDAAPVVVASGMGYLAEKIVEIASDSGVPVYEDTSLATMLSQLELGQEIPPALYQAIVEIYVYFLQFDPDDPEGLMRKRLETALGQTEKAPANAETEQAKTEQVEGEN